jgi:hypothetical protein
MSKLAQALQSFEDSFAALGTAGGAERLAARLRSICQANERYFNVAVVMLSTMFIVELAIVYMNAADKYVLVAATTAFGVSVSGTVWMMVRFWREKVASEMLAELCGLDRAILRQVVERLLDRLGRIETARPGKTDSQTV